VPQIDNLDPDLKVLQNLMTFARYFDIPKQEALRRSMDVLRLFKLDERTNSRIEELSGGMKRRLLIARGFINNPKIVILDEPTIGLDPQGKFLVWRKLTEMKAQGVSQLLCTQNMEEAEYLCDRVAIMSEGKIVSLDAPEKLISQVIGGDVWEINVNRAERDGLLQKLQSHGLLFEDIGTRVHVFHVDNAGLLQELVGSADKLRHRPATLEDVFFKLTGRSLNE
jgi:lipooligosaccharide transport system ATP-binding protein